MKIDEFRKLEQKISGYNFHESYKNANKMMKIFSYFGHIASIFLAFFFLSKIIGSAMTDNPVIVFISSIIILILAELLKRDTFDKFSIQSLKDSGISKGSIPLLVASLMLISFSFFSTINGAKEFSSKEQEIESVTREDIRSYTDSVRLLYQNRIDILENQNIELFEANKLLDDEARELPSNYVTSRNRVRQRIDVNNKQIERNREVIESIKSERDSDIESYEKRVRAESDENKKENTKTSFLFVLISALIELLILGGVYFNQYYDFRSYKEHRKKLEKDPNYQKWALYDQILTILITDETKMNQKLPYNKSIIEICKVNDIIVLPKDLSNFIKIASGLGIIKVSGSVKYIAKTKEIAREILRNHFGIR